MPVILSQHFSPADRVYKDAEGALYHYPRQYFARIQPYTSFIYYRPGGSSERRTDERHYFGHGTLGTPYPDWENDRLRFVDVIQYAPFDVPVPLRDPSGNYYETGTAAVPQAQSAVRQISEIAYHRILAAADVAVTGVSFLPTTLGLVHAPASPKWPMDVLRTMERVPAGAGYVPRGGEPPNVYEAAALQERARADHQHVLGLFVRRVQSLGGTCLYNNNVDLLARIGNERLLVEAKSLNDLRDAVDRMRYGMGQLMDYRVRYRAEIQDARPVLAFGRAPARDAGWIAEVLEGNGVAFACSTGDELIAMNEQARTTRLFAG